MNKTFTLNSAKSEAAPIYETLRALEIRMFDGFIKPQCIIRGDPFGVLPPGTKGLIVNTILNHVDIGTPTQEHRENEVVIRQLHECVVQLDFYHSNSEVARGLAESFKAFVRTPQCVEVFNREGIGVLYSEDVRNLTTTGADNKPNYRWMLTLHLSHTHKLTVSQETFDNIVVGVKNIDVHFPPSGD